MSRIAKTVVGYLDLDKIINISSPIREYRGPYEVVGFSIDVQLRDASIKHFRLMTDEEYKTRHCANPLWIQNVQLEIDSILKLWRE